MSASANIAKFIKGTQAAKARARRAAKRALEVFGAKVIGQAQEMVPVDTGALAASGVFPDAVEEGDQITQTIGFNTNYAAAVHERLDQKHTQGQAKFLSTAIERMKPKFEPFVAGQVKKAMEGGAG